METNTGPWIAQLIRTEYESLVAATVAAVRATVPEYAALPDIQIETIFGQVYKVFARSLETDDMAPWREYFQAALAQRARADITPAQIIATVAIVQEQVVILADRTDPTQAAAVRSIARSTANRLRLLVSELNLAALTHSPPPGEG
jgi:hypothetical protein